MSILVLNAAIAPISNHRLLSFDGREVSFRWTDYADSNKKRKMTLSADEFLRRFLLHVLPAGFVRIRHFGFLANRHRTSLIALCRKLIGEEQLLPECNAATKLRVRISWSRPRCSSTMLVVERLSAAQALHYLKTAVGIDSS
jgi:Putative transposase